MDGGKRWLWNGEEWQIWRTELPDSLLVPPMGQVEILNCSPLKQIDTREPQN